MAVTLGPQGFLAKIKPYCQSENGVIWPFNAHSSRPHAKVKPKNEDHSELQSASSQWKQKTFFKSCKNFFQNKELNVSSIIAKELLPEGKSVCVQIDSIY